VSRGGLQETQASEIQGREDDALVDVDKTPEHDTYCSVFGDPSGAAPDTMIEAA
jgi:hypothetical protein